MRRFALAFFAALIGLAIAVPPAPAADKPLEKVTFGYFPVADFLMVFIAKDQGFFAAHGIDATLQLMTSNATSIPSALVGNSIQVGGTTLPVVLQADDSGLNVKAIAGSGSYFPGSKASAIVVPAGSPAKSPKDLEGKSVGVTGLNNMVHIVLVKWFADQGADPKKIHFVEIQIQQTPDLIKAKTVDAAVAFDPFLTRIIQSDSGRVLSYYTDFIPQGTATMVWAVAGDFAAAHPETVKNIRAAMADALAYHDAHPDEDDATLAKYLPVPPAILKTIPRSPYINGVSASQVTYWSGLMTAQKLIAKPADPKAVLVP
ncbi:MAG TPA: ABC transporter substrate-binding protein [Stellaceae bacterium]|nr:ABC transporter substrate-binding protein [Stellaceae bacterium]